jgi:hypothetical protein
MGTLEMHTIDDWFQQAVQFHECGNLAQAEGIYREILRIYPAHSNALNNLGLALQARGKIDGAIDCYRRALSVDPVHVNAHNNLGGLLSRHGDIGEAIQCYRHALRIEPSHADANNNLGIALYNEGQLDEAALCFDRAIANNSHHAKARWNRANLRLLRGDYAGAWPDYEQRWSQAGLRPPAFAQPRWDGSPLNGKTILIYAEQGLGDTIQFARFIPHVKELGGRVILACQPALLRVLKNLDSIAEMLPFDRMGSAAFDTVNRSFDAHAPLQSLAGILGITVATVPNKAPYLKSDAALIAKWRSALEFVTGFRIGIVWQGNPDQWDDRTRSVPLAAFSPLAQIRGVSLISLQVGPGIDQLVNAPFPIIDLGCRFDRDSFHDLAAVLPNLNLVITVCTSVAHLAGAIGFSAWVALKTVPYWCWMLDRTESHWYPTLRLFRQTKQGHWDSIFQQMAAQVPQFLNHQSP